jgi:hypothetical protein
MGVVAPGTEITMKASILAGFLCVLWACSAVPIGERTEALQTCTAGQPCCPPAPFHEGYTCTGTPSQHETCWAPFDNDPAYGTVCTGCGNHGQFCCCAHMDDDGSCMDTPVCQNGLFCNDPTHGTDISYSKCEACGENGSACCAGNTCNAGLECVTASLCNPNSIFGGRCEPATCGNPGQACCAGSTCDTGAVCNTTTNTCGCLAPK